MVLFTIGLYWFLMEDSEDKYMWFVYEDNVVVYANSDPEVATQWAEDAKIRNPIIVKSVDRRYNRGR